MTCRAMNKPTGPNRATNLAIAVLLAGMALLNETPVRSHQEATCQGESIIAELDRKDPQLTARILRDAAAVKNSEAMLWRVERDGGTPSYLFGTIHVTDRSLQALSPRALSALRASSTVALETLEESSKTFGYTMARAGKLMSARDKPLQRYLDEDELKVVERSVSQAGYPAELALGIRPWGATLFLSGSPCEAAGTHSAKPIDLIVAEEAKRAVLKLVGLETMLEQFESLAAIDDEVQVSWLKASIASHDRLHDVGHTLAELYRFRRLDAVWQLTREMAPTAGLTDANLAAIRAGLVGARNSRLVARSLPLVEAGGAFVAVGALHLSGDDGMVETLRRHGFILTAIE